MLATSKDILYLVIAFCIVWVTGFLCWTFYYVMRLLRNANKIVEELRVRLDELAEAIGYIRGKVEHISGLLTLASDGVTGLVKRAVTNKAKAWISGASNTFDDSAKQAVDNAVAATAKKMKKVAAKMRK